VDCPGRRKEGERGRNHFIPGNHIQRPERKQEGIGATGAGDPATDSGQPGNRLLKRRNFRPHDEGLAFNHATDGRIDLVADGVVLGLEIQQRYRHGAPGEKVS
jgi:hypothetical protein